jgi:ATP-dependent Clp protease ATP-binding subunit ClpC
VFERFTDAARAVIVLAQQEARSFNHAYIGTEHLLLGLLDERNGVAAGALGTLGATTDLVREQLAEIVGRGAQPVRGHVPFTPRAKKVLELSLREAVGLKSNSIGTEHILLGVIREGGGVATQIMMALGADLPRAREVVLALVRTGAVDRTPNSEPAPPTVLPTEDRQSLRAEIGRLRSLLQRHGIDPDGDISA